MGKTALAQQAARDYAAQTGRPAFACPLAAADGRIDLRRRLAEALGLSPAENAPTTEQLSRALGARGEALLVLDAFERLAPAAEGGGTRCGGTRQTSASS